MTRLARIRNRFACLLAATVVLAVYSSARAQPRGQEFWEGTHAFRKGILHDLYGLRALESLLDIEKEQKNTLLIVLGRTDPFNELDPDDGLLLGDEPAIQRFLRAGGAVLVASDHGKMGRWQGVLGVKPLGAYVRIEPAEAGYRGKAECPIVRIIPNAKPWLFEDINKVATNKPTYLKVFSTDLPLLAGFPPGCSSTVGVKLDLFPPTETAFAVGREWGDNGGRYVVLADHSVFINSMMIQPDNDNFYFADNCIRWLTGPHRRTRALFIEDNVIVTNFDVPVEDIALPPLPTINDLVPKANAFLSDLEKEDAFNQPFYRVSSARLLQVLLILLTLGLAMLGFVRLRQSRVRFDPKLPAPPVGLDGSGTAPSVMEQRQRAMLRDGNLWEAARGVALQFFSPSADPTGPAKLIVTVNAGWWQRRRLRKQVQRLWDLANSDRPSRVPPSEFRRLLAQVRYLQTAQANGILRIDWINPAKDSDNA